MVTKKKGTTQKQVGLSSPWETIHKQIIALLGPDTEVHVGSIYEGNGNTYVFDICSKNGKKIAALEKVLKSHFDLGNVTLAINFIHERDDEEVTAQDYKDAFEGNSNFVDTVVTSKGLFQDLTYVIFAKEILQFFNDDLSDLYGNMSIIVADAAKQVCNVGENMYFSTANGTEE